MKDNEEKLIEALARQQHDIWAHWMNYQFTKCEKRADGSMIIPSELVARWTRQAGTSYCNLSDQEQESDRHQALKVMVTIYVAINGVPAQAGQQHNYNMYCSTCEGGAALIHQTKHLAFFSCQCGQTTYARQNNTSK